MPRTVAEWAVWRESNPKLTPRGNRYIVPPKRGMKGRKTKRVRVEKESSLRRCRLGCGALLFPRDIEEHRCDKPTIGDWAAVRTTSVFDGP